MMLKKQLKLHGNLDYIAYYVGNSSGVPSI